ncbi:hypothetical protein AZF37_00660 [endosymbiont 'TC1' of Trimyema compressum]|nr:hypothetical protein AZF37_00660 [endosymbiont 'TC1' of Trimyema compressum]
MNGYYSIRKATLAWSRYCGIYSIHGAAMLWVLGKAFMEETFGDTIPAESRGLIESLYYSPVWIVVMVALGIVLGIAGCFFWL